jgi:hypothetical protein
MRRAQFCLLKWWPKFKSGGQRDHQRNCGWQPEILDNFPSERGKILNFQYRNWPTEEDIELED